MPDGAKLSYPKVCKNSQIHESIVSASHTLNIRSLHFYFSIYLIKQNNRMTDGAKLIYPRSMWGGHLL